MKKYLLSTILVCVLAITAFAGNVGYVKGLGIIKGNDGNSYIYVRTSGINVDFGCTTNPTDRLWGDFYIPWNATDIIAVSDLSNLQKALQNNTWTLEALSGIGTSAVLGTPQVSVVTKWIIVHP